MGDALSFVGFAVCLLVTVNFNSAKRLPRRPHLHSKRHDGDDCGPVSHSPSTGTPKCQRFHKWCCTCEAAGQMPPGNLERGPFPNAAPRVRSTLRSRSLSPSLTGSVLRIPASGTLGYFLRSRPTGPLGADVPMSQPGASVARVSGRIGALLVFSHIYHVSITSLPPRPF